MELKSNVTDTALIFEGGGMRGAFTAAIVTSLLGAGIHMDYVAGISAGSSNTVNYLSRAPVRARKSFVDFADDPRFGSWRTWIRGKGFFNAHYIYEECWLPDGPLPFDFDTFMANPARFKIGSYDVELGKTVYWSREDITQPVDLMRRVRASSSIPGMMPSVWLDGRLYVDGALGEGGGIPLPIAQRDGNTKFFVVLTRTRDYIKEQYRPQALYKLLYGKHPTVAAGILARAKAYNDTREELLELERAGQALLVFPDQITIENRTSNVAQ
ncbi:MAG: patatin family protein, partial [Propionibacteriaceae bacterium]|nr:patatin family protein [Propionibacteriaceae bacterium]